MSLFNERLNIRLDRNGTWPDTVFSHVTHVRTYTLPAKVREANEVFPQAFILLNIQESVNQRATSNSIVSPRLDDLKNRKSERGKTEGVCRSRHFDACATK